MTGEEEDTVNDLILPYPNTCEECPDRGEYKVFGDYLIPDRIKLWDSDYQEYRFQNLGWPKRCKSCNARAQAFKRAKASVKRLEELRVAVQDMKAARKWLRRKRDKIIESLDCVAGTDVMECVTTQVDDKFHHHVHMHGIWIMPYHDIKYVGEIMVKYVGRDQVRAIKPIVIQGEHGEYTMSAFAQARNYLIKYLTKQPNTRRSLWGFARKGLTEEKFFSRCFEIYDKWIGSKAVASPTDVLVAPVERASATAD